MGPGEERGRIWAMAWVGSPSAGAGVSICDGGAGGVTLSPVAMPRSPTPSLLPLCPRVPAQGNAAVLFSCPCFHIHLASPQHSPSPRCPRRPIFAAETHVPARSCWLLA